MKMFDLKNTVLSLAKPNVNNIINSIERYRGKVSSITRLKKIDKLKTLSLRSSAVASCALGNVFLSDQEAINLFEKDKAPVEFQEHMARGYVDALKLIDEVYKYQPFDSLFISTLHFYMYRGYNPEVGGKFKYSQNYVQKIKANGKYDVIFTPVGPEEAEPLLNELIRQFNLCMQDEDVNKLILIAVFLCDFMCIHPYSHGNGRVSRLILNFLLKKHGYIVDDYFSISYLLQKQIDD